MVYPNEDMGVKSMRNKIVVLALLIAIASILYTFENLIPLPLPWFRLGLSNIITLLTLKWWGIKESLLVVILRVLIGGLLSGKILDPIFIMALSSGITSACGMGLLLRYDKKFFSLIGISIMGAVIKNLTQLSTAYLLFIKNISIFSLIPIFIIVSLITGTIIGILAHLIDEKIKVRNNNYEISK